ncbi:MULTISPECIES: HD domain-containing protein [Rickettsieae]|uniref:HD domain-containing protein n=1 Tax=Rickettsieae TaxID=33988 RepID=UPI000B9A5A5A|nr:HD domain-containing protein [Rickettsia endosymbiont of Culicoides newsteadi]OZG31522.1 guanosine polyphosphate pyrophosphohydrolase [Rickettsia endosymbiont of Culicoides newsteadi]
MEDIANWQAKFECCDYSDKLLNKLILLNNKVPYPVDIREIIKAIYYAKKYHGSQRRQSGEPYYSHPIEVAYMVAQYTAQEIPTLFKTEMIVTSLLHDTIEDTALTEEMIARIFGSIVANQVEGLTRIKPYGKISAKETLDLLFQQERYDVILIKLFDRIHNLQTLRAKSSEKALKIVKETVGYFITLCVQLEIPIAERQLTKLCYQNLSTNGSI